MSAASVRNMTLNVDATARDLGRLKEATRQVVGSVFFGTLLKTMRQSGLRGKYGHGGHGEEVFQAQLDAMLAERAGKAMGHGLGEELYRRLQDQQRRISGLRNTPQRTKP